MLTGTNRLYVVASRLLAVAERSLVTSPAGVPGRACVVPGAVAWDDCTCDGGQLAVSLQRVWLAESFPSEVGTEVGPTVVACQAPYLVAQYVVQVIRCAPQPQGSNLAPTCGELDAAAQVVTTDAALVLDAVTCALVTYEANDDVSSSLVRPQVVVGPSGACVGSELVVLVGLQR